MIHHHLRSSSHRITRRAQSTTFHLYKYIRRSIFLLLHTNNILMMKSIKISFLLIFYFFGTAAAQKESLLAAETSLDLPEELADSPLSSRSERVQEGRKLQDACPFCPNGVTYPDVILSVETGATCKQVAEYAQTLTQWNELCATAEYAEVACCPPKNASPTLQPTDSPPGSYSMSAFYSGKGGKRRSGGKGGKNGGGSGKSMSVSYGGKGGKKSGSGRGRGGKGGKR